MAAKDPKASEEQVGTFLKSRGINYQPAPQDIMDVGLRVYKSAVKNLKSLKSTLHGGLQLEKPPIPID